MTTRPAVVSRFDRLTGPDRANLLAERPGVPWHLGLLGILDGGPLTATDGSLRLDLVRSALRRALPAAPRLSQVVHPTGPGQGPPIWVDTAVDLDRHLRVMPLAPPGDDQAFLHSCANVLAPPMNRRRPLWDLTLLPGMAGGHLGLVLRVHHAIADGVAAAAIVTALFSERPTPAAGSRPTPPLTGPRLAADAWWVRTATAGPALRRLPGLVAAALTQLRALHRPGEPAPRTSLNGRLGSGRRLAAVRVPLEPVHEAAHAAGGTVNDAVLAAVAGALRTVLESRGERAAVTLRASVPVSLRDSGADPTGNRVGLMLVPLPLAAPDVNRRLATIAAATRAMKGPARAAGTLTVSSSTLAVRLALPLMRHQHLVNLFVTNVPGPVRPLTFAGARLLEAYPAAPIAGNVTLGVGVLSYAGDLSFGIVADAASWPDLPVLAAALRAELAALTGLPSQSAGSHG